MAVFYASSGGPNYAERDLPTTDFLGERPELTLRAEWKKVMLNGVERETAGEHTYGFLKRGRESRESPNHKA